MTATLRRIAIRVRFAAPALVMLLATHAAPERAAASTPTEAGYRDFSYGTSITPAPTGEKPESKLWWNDGAWWGVLWSVAAGSYRIHRLDLASQSWISTETAVDSRPGSKCDVLWTAGQLYVVSHIYSTSPGAVSTANAGRLYRYRYDSVGGTYTLDSGFPVLVNRSKSETLVLDRDSAGKLWVTWVEGGKVRVNASSGDDQTWGEPFDLPVQGNNTLWDDISSVVAMDGKIGIMWSNQADERMYFAVHVDGNADGDWEPREDALADAALGAVADDHINLKYSCAGDGVLYSAVKTSLTGSRPGIYLLKRSGSGTWTRHVVGTISEGHTRPLVLLKQDENRVYVFATSTPPGADDRQVIYMKSASMSDLLFPTGPGTPFIQSSLDTLVNDPTGTKQCLDATTGIAVLASARDTRFYLHRAVSGGTPPPPPPPPGDLTFTPIHDAKVVSSFPTRNFGADPSLQVRAGDPVYTSYLKFEVTGLSGPAQSAKLRLFCTDASVEGGRLHSVSNSYAGTSTAWLESGLTWSNAPTISGSPLDQKGSVALGSWVEFDVTSAIVGSGTYSFGLVTGSTNSAIYSSSEGTQPPELRIQSGTPPPPQGPVAYEQGSTGGSVNTSTVSTSGSFSEPGLYLAAISSRPRVAAVSVSGLGLTWTLVKSQCSGRNQTGIEIWRAQGTPASGGVVTATYALAPSSAVISVSRYSGAASIGAVVSGNTMGTGGSCSGGTDNASYSIPLSASSGSVAFGAVAMRHRTHDPGSGFTERAEVAQGSSGSIAGLAVEDKAIPSAQGLSVAGTFDGVVDWAAIGIEILPTGATALAAPALAIQEATPSETIRLSNHPNPTRGETRIHYGIDHPGLVRLAIHDVAGRLVSMVTDEVHRAGMHTRAWDGRDSQGRTLSRGVYFCRMETATQRKAIKILLVR